MLLRPFYTEITGLLSNTLKISHVQMRTEILGMIDNSSSHPLLSNLHDKVTYLIYPFSPQVNVIQKF